MTVTRETPPVHPAAAWFPMMDDDDLADLAESIRANGLRQPIVLDADGLLIDGRNRLAACRLAGVEPTFTTLEGDALEYIADTNLDRRHLTKGAKAMIATKFLQAQGNLLLNSNLDRRDTRDQGISQAAREHGISHQYLSQAKLVLTVAPDLAQSVITGSLSLPDAYAHAKRLKDGLAAETEQQKRAAAEHDANLARLRVEAPEWADQVVEGTLDLTQAIRNLDTRQRVEREQNERTTRQVIAAIDVLILTFSMPPDDLLDSWNPDEPQSQRLPFIERWNPAGLRRMAADFLALADAMANREGRE